MTMEVDQATEPDREYDSDKLRRDPQRGDEERGPSGPDRPNEGRVTRSRSSSINSVSSGGARGAATALAASRRSRRSDSFNENRRSTTTAKNPGSEEGGSTVVLSDDTEEEEFFSPSQSREPSLKRKMEMGEGEEVQGATQRKQGRPPKTGDYVGRSEAVRELVELEKERAHLEVEKTLRNMTTGQVFANIERDLEAAIEEVEYSPTADLASRARDCMAQVMKVAKGSKNLQGGYVKLLKQAAVMGAATAEVLRTRADRGGENDSDLSRQVKNMSRELAVVKREVLAAREEAEYLRRKLSEERERATRTTRRRVINDDFPPPPSPRGRRADHQASEYRNSEEPPEMDRVSPMETETEASLPEEEREYNDAKRKEEILPPREIWPPALRPPIQGQVKVLEDGLLDGHRVLLRRMPTVEERESKQEKRPSPQPRPTEGGKEGAQLLL